MYFPPREEKGETPLVLWCAIGQLAPSPRETDRLLLSSHWFTGLVHRTTSQEVVCSLWHERAACAVFSAALDGVGGRRTDAELVCECLACRFVVFFGRPSSSSSQGRAPLGGCLIGPSLRGRNLLSRLPLSLSVCCVRCAFYPPPPLSNFALLLLPQLAEPVPAGALEGVPHPAQIHPVGPLVSVGSQPQLTGQRGLGLPPTHPQVFLSHPSPPGRLTKPVTHSCLDRPITPGSQWWAKTRKKWGKAPKWPPPRLIPSTSSSEDDDDTSAINAMIETFEARRKEKVLRKAGRGDGGNSSGTPQAAGRLDRPGKGAHLNAYLSSRKSLAQGSFPSGHHSTQESQQATGA